MFKDGNGEIKKICKEKTPKRRSNKPENIQ